MRFIKYKWLLINEAVSKAIKCYSNPTEKV